MLEIVGNIWDQNTDAIVIPTNMVVKSNGHLVMGAGLAKQALDRYPDLALEWGNHYIKWQYSTPEEKTDFALVKTAKVRELNGHKVTLISAPTKYDWREQSDLTLVMRSAKGIQEIINTNPHIETAVLPQLGCGLGGLKWERVKKVIEPFLNDDRFRIITPT